MKFIVTIIFIQLISLSYGQGNRTEIGVRNRTFNSYKPHREWEFISTGTDRISDYNTHTIGNDLFFNKYDSSRTKIVRLIAGYETIGSNRKETSLQDDGSGSLNHTRISIKTISLGFSYGKNISFDKFDLQCGFEVPFGLNFQNKNILEITTYNVSGSSPKEVIKTELPLEWRTGAHLWLGGYYNLNNILSIGVETNIGFLYRFSKGNYDRIYEYHSSSGAIINTTNEPYVYSLSQLSKTPTSLMLGLKVGF